MRYTRFLGYAAFAIALAAVTVTVSVLVVPRLGGGARTLFVSKVDHLKVTSTMAAAANSAVQAPSTVVAAALNTSMDLGTRPVSGVAEASSFLAKDATAVTAADGTLFQSPNPETVWVISVTAPGQDGWSSVTGVVLVDAATGKVVANSLVGQN